MQLTHLNGWRAVEAVCRMGTIARAAEELGVTRAAVAAQLRGLEDRLGRRLFVRRPGGLEPTAELLAVAAPLTEALAALARVQETLARSEPGNRVAVSVTQTFAETWLPRHLPDLFSKLGPVDLTLNTTWEVIDLRNSDLHFAIRYMGEAEDGYGALPLFGSGVVPVCTPDFAARYGLSAARIDLSGIPIVHIDVPTSDPDWADWGRWGQEMGVTLPQEVEAQPRYTLSGSGVRLAQSGVGLVLGGLSEVFAALQAGTLIMPFGKKSVLPSLYTHKLIWIRERPLSPLQRGFRDWISEKAEADRRLMRQLFEL